MFFGFFLFFKFFVQFFCEKSKHFINKTGIVYIKTRSCLKLTPGHRQNRKVPPPTSLRSWSSQHGLFRLINQNITIMRNLTQHYSDEYIMDCIAKAGGNHHKCTANVQYSINANQWHLNIWQDFSTGWDCDDRIIYSELASPEECHEHYDDLLISALTSKEERHEYYDDLPF